MEIAELPRDVHPFMLGTQFHPEAETASALDMKIFEEFVIGSTGEVPEVKLVA